MVNAEGCVGGEGEVVIVDFSKVTNSEKSQRQRLNLNVRTPCGLYYFDDHSGYSFKRMLVCCYSSER